VVARARGRPSGGDSGTRDAILTEARRQFGELGYRATTLRAVGRGANVDPRLVLHYFGSKQELFKQTAELPLGADEVAARVFGGPREEVGSRAATLLMSMLEDADARRALTGILRAAASEPEAAELIRDILVERLLTPLAAHIGGEQPELRASLLASQVVGLTAARHVVGLPPLAAASHTQLVRALAPVFQHYLTGDWVLEGGAEGGVPRSAP
jgi:AcrR family transcriptional regulator